MVKTEWDLVKKFKGKWVAVWNNKLVGLGDKQTIERQKLEGEIKQTDTEIDDLVYQLYGITTEEKKIIEESLK